MEPDSADGPMEALDFLGGGTGAEGLKPDGLLCETTSPGPPPPGCGVSEALLLLGGVRGGVMEPLRGGVRGGVFAPPP